jgi:pimeloyl-ACP methyl ester carboxylesterase
MNRRPGVTDERDAFVDVAADGARVRVHVREDGVAAGPPIVLLHGLSGSLRWFDRVVPLLGDTFRLIRVDLLGHGATGGPAVDAPVQAQAVRTVLEQLEVDDATVVGHSFGADVAVDLAEHCPQVRCAVIVAQAPDYADLRRPRSWRLITVPVLGAVAHRVAWALGSAVRVVLMRDNEFAAQGLRDFRSVKTAMFRVILVDRRDRLARRPLDDQLRAAAKPALVILGSKDHFYGDRCAPRYRAVGAQVEILPDAGHSPIVDAPERIAELVRTFALAD